MCCEKDVLLTLSIMVTRATEALSLASLCSPSSACEAEDNEDKIPQQLHRLELSSNPVL